MEVIYFQKHISEAEDKRFKEYITEKLPAIRNLLTKFADDAQTLKVTIEKYEKHDAFEVEFHLSLPSKIIIAKEASHTIAKAIDFSKDRLIVQIKKHMANLRHDRSHQTIRETEAQSVVVEAWQEA